MQTEYAHLNICICSHHFHNTLKILSQESRADKVESKLSISNTIQKFKTCSRIIKNNRMKLDYTIP